MPEVEMPPDETTPGPSGSGSSGGSGTIEEIGLSGVSPRLNFIKDLWRNNHSAIIDDSSLSSIVSRNICRKLNQASGYVNFNQTASGFYAVLENTSIVPSLISINTTTETNHVTNFRLEITLNDVLIATHFYNVGNSSKSSTKTVSSDDRVKLVRNFHGTPNYVKLQTFGSGAPDSFRIKTVDISFSGISYYNDYSNPTPEIVSFYPTSINSSNTINNSGINPTDGSYLSGPTNTSGTDSTWVYRNLDDSYNLSGIVFNQNDLELYFDTSGYFHDVNSTRNIDRLMFSCRYSSASGDSTNIQSFSSLRLYSDIYGEMGYGSGFHMHFTSGFSRVESTMALLHNEYASRKYDSTNFFSNFRIKLDDVPANAKISAAQLDFYLSNDDILCMSIPGGVVSRRGSKDPSETDFINSGHNRLKQNNYDQLLFDTAYKQLNTNETLNKSFSTPLFWKSYYEEEIDTSTFHNHRYSNSLYLKEDEYLHETFDSSNDYSILLHCSTSGNYSHLNGLNGANVLSKYNGAGQPEFLLNIDNDAFQFISYDNAGSPSVTNFPSYFSNIILITKHENIGSDSINLYISNGTSELINTVYQTGNLRSGSGKLYIGGSGLTDFAGYIHEYGISSQHLDDDEVEAFSNSRNRISSVLSEGSGLRLFTGNISGNLSDYFDIYFSSNSVDNPELYQSHTPMIFAYNTLLTNPSAYTMLLDYENHTNNPSGMVVSGYYIDQKFLHNAGVAVGFKATLPSGSNAIEIMPSEYADVYSVEGTRTGDSQAIELFLNSPNNLNYSHDFKINSISMSFDGWYLSQTGIGIIDFVTHANIVSNDSFDMYLRNQYGSSGLDFYMSAHSANNDYLEFYMNAAIIEQSGVSFYTTGQQVGYDDFDMLLQGPLMSDGNEGILPLFIEGTTPIPFSGNLNLNIPGASVPTLGNTLYFTTVSELDQNNSINLYIGSSLEESEDSINFYTPCSNETSQMFNIFMYNQNSGVDYGLDFSMYSAYNMSGNLNMVI